MEEITNQTESSKKVYETAKSLLGQNLATNGALGCAETVNIIFHKALGVSIGGGTSTTLMYPFLKNEKKYARIRGNPLPGDVIISPTSSGDGTVQHGHVGIVAKFGILSNNSNDGRLRELYTIDSWYKSFMCKGHFAVEIYRVL